MEKLIDERDIHYYDIELSNDESEEEEAGELSEENKKFHQDVIKDCSSWVGICHSRECLMEYQNTKNDALDTFEHFKDKYDFHVVAHLLHGKRKNTFLTIRECKHCHNLQFYGSGSSIALLMSILDTDLINRGVLDSGVDMDGNPVLPEVNPLGSDIVVTDMDGNPIEGELSIEGLTETKPTTDQ